MLTRSRTHLPKPTPRTRTRTRGAEKPPYGNFSWRNTGSANKNSSVSPTPAIDKTVHHYDGSQDISVQPYGHTGRRHDDETGLQYFRERYYDAELGRFASRDPLQYVDGMSMYRGYYVPNGMDPTGLYDYECATVITILRNPKRSLQQRHNIIVS
jgi:RHS repeat-associated protein